MNGLKKIDENILRLSENSLVKLLLFGNPKYNLIDNYHVLNASINFVLNMKDLKILLCSICLPFLYCYFPFHNIIWPYCFPKYTESECNLYCCFYLLF